MRRLMGGDPLGRQSSATPPEADVEGLEYFEGNHVRLGDAIKTSARFLGIRPCAGCHRRADLLNRWRLPWRRG